MIFFFFYPCEDSGHTELNNLTDCFMPLHFHQTIPQRKNRFLSNSSNNKSYLGFTT